MRYRSDLERLATLDAAAIEVACTDCTTVGELVARAVDEYLEFDIAAEEAEARGDDEHAAYLRQEAAAWRATVRVLRMMAADAGHGGRRHGAA
ncbi:hypothetical protein [Gordonia sp. NPDC058843]|uniref:hypothetical protein n=1 Tax=Gordonia sp. NPDC058843 TaxID=3346648 RepID=UPI003696E48B